MLRTPLISLYSAAMSFTESSSSVIHCWLRPGCNPFVMDRFALRRLIWENALDTIELVSFLEAVQNELGIAFGSGLRLRGIK